MSIRREISNLDMHGTIRIPQLLGPTLGWLFEYWHTVYNVYVENNSPA
jgi:hypothetical protein